MDARKLSLIVILCAYQLQSFGQLSKKNTALLTKNVTSVKLVFKNLEPSSGIIISKKQDLGFWLDALRQSHHDSKLRCDSTVQIVYYNKSHPILTIYFSSRGTHSRYKNEAISYNFNDRTVISKCTYYVGMYIDEKFHELAGK